MWIASLALALSVSFLLSLCVRSSGRWEQAAVFVLLLPVMGLVAPVLIMLVSYQLFGIDLID
jgi:uncharacterized membrane protein (DUF106 family)